VPQTITIDKDTNGYLDGSLYVVEQVGLDVMDSVTWTAVRYDDFSPFTSLMRANYVLFHDREVGVLVSRRTLHAWYNTKQGRYPDKFGNTCIAAPTALLVAREGEVAELVNINYVAKPKRSTIPPLPPITLTPDDTKLKDTRRMDFTPVLEAEDDAHVGHGVFEPRQAAPNARQRAKLVHYAQLLEAGVDGKEAHRLAYTDTLPTH